MPTRILREGIISSEKINSLSERAELFYRKLMSVVDDYGRFYANPISILGACYPLRPTVCEADVKQMLSECIAKDLILIYGNGKYLLMLNLNQQIRSKSKFPQPSENELLIKCKSNDKQMCSLGGGEDVVEGGGESADSSHSFSEIPSWVEFWGYCQTQACLLPAEWFVRDKFEAANSDHWKNKNDWRAYARRCKGWWENDGRPMKPKVNGSHQNPKRQSYAP